MRICPAGFFVLRAPRLPLEDVIVPSELAAADATHEPRARIRDRLEFLVARRDIMEALYLASPDLCDAIARWRSEPDTDEGRRVELVLHKYLLRMAPRAAPFGLFAGLTVG